MSTSPKTTVVRNYFFHLLLITIWFLSGVSPLLYRFSNKGFVYTLLDYHGTNLHVFGTHMQSDDARCSRGQAASCRALAMDAWRSFVESRKIPPEELIVFAGDFNVNRDTAEFNTTLISPHPAPLVPASPLPPRSGGGGGAMGIATAAESTSFIGNKGESISLHAPDVYQGHEYTWDGTDNSLAHGNYEDRKNRNYIDYVFVVETKNHPATFQSVVQTALVVHSPKFTIAGHVYEDFSDHFPVSATIILNKDPTPTNNTTPAPS